MYNAAVRIFRRRSLRALGRQLLADCRAARHARHEIQDHDLVLFLVDCWNKALSKVCKTKTFQYTKHLKRDGKPYQKFKSLLDTIHENQINPFVFFSFCFEQRRRRGIAPTVYNVCTEKALSHFLDWRRINQHRAATYRSTKGFEEQIANQLQSDLQTFCTLQLRRQSPQIGPQELCVFSNHSLAILSLCGVECTLSEEAGQFLENMQLDTEFGRQVATFWNSALRDQRQRLNLLLNPHTEPVLVQRFGAIKSLLESLELSQ